MKRPRRAFIKQLAASAFCATGIAPIIVSCGSNQNEIIGKDMQEQSKGVEPIFFKISLGEWSLNKTIFSGDLTNLAFPERAKNLFGFEAVEYVNQFFIDRAKDQDYLSELKLRTDDLGVRNVLIMIDKEGDLATPDDRKRLAAVENHYKWIEAAKFLGCHAIRVNASGEGTAEEVSTAAVDGLGRLCEFGSAHNIGVIVENHGSHSSNGKWLADVIDHVNDPMCGTLPDFGNFCIERAPDDHDNCLEEYDRYQGMKDLMPFAKGVSAKAIDFDNQGNEIHTDFLRMLSIVKESGFIGYVGIEYEGNGMSEEEGIMMTKKLLEKVGAQLA